MHKTRADARSRERERNHIGLRSDDLGASGGGGKKRNRLITKGPSGYPTKAEKERATSQGGNWGCGEKGSPERFDCLISRSAKTEASPMRGSAEVGKKMTLRCKEEDGRGRRKDYAPRAGPEARNITGESASGGGERHYHTIGPMGERGGFNAE